MQGFQVIHISPDRSVLDIPEGWSPDFDSDPFEERIRLDDRFVEYDHEPDSAEIAAELSASEFQAELRPYPWGSETWRLRVRYPVAYTTETRGGNPTRLYRLADPQIPASWGRAACFWLVWTTAANHLALHNYIATTLGFAPIGGAWAALDPADQSQFLPNAVQTALGLTNQQQLERVTALRNGLQAIGYAATALSAIVATPAGKTEDNLMRALVADLGFTMADLQRAAMRF